MMLLLPRSFFVYCNHFKTSNDFLVYYFFCREKTFDFSFLSSDVWARFPKSTKYGIKWSNWTIFQPYIVYYPNIGRNQVDTI